MRIEHLQDRQKEKRKRKENEKNWVENREGKTTVTFLEELFSIGSPKYGAFSIGGTNIVDLSANLNVL